VKQLTLAAVLPCLLLQAAACSDSGTQESSGADTLDELDGSGSADTAEDTEGSGSADTVDGSGSADTTEDTSPPAPLFETPDPACRGDAPGTVEIFYTGFARSEGIAFGPDGLLYVTADNALWRFTADGTATRVVELPQALGLAPTPTGVVVARQGESYPPTLVDGGLTLVEGSGQVTELSTTIESGNAVMRLDSGDFIVADNLSAKLQLVTAAGETRLLEAAVPSPNGLGYSPDHRSIYVNSTFTTRGQLTRFDVGSDGLPVASSATVIAEMGPRSTPDGIVIDAKGRVYVAANLQSKLVRVDPATGEKRDVITGINAPASMAFGAGAGFDPCSLYITALFGPMVYRVVLDGPGLPLIP
jgi:sugar lactone lactonase YvrE